MKKYSYLIIILILMHSASIAQKKNATIKYSIKNEKSFLYKEKIIEGDTIVGYGISKKVFFKSKFNLKCSFFDDKVFLNNQLIYCFKNVQYYESLLFFNFNNKEYLFIYPHYYGRVGPYVWNELGILIEIKPKPIIQENMDYFEDYEIDRMMKFKKFKVKNLTTKIFCADGSLIN
ncbi:MULTISPECIES: hypothetical protein [unclassified Flavobacterium]|uniref:hypothetical protein n=1 Tax=unclassified Flavobacterium TaxID=196869 RepID=UPI000AC8D668|nr:MULTISPECIES: hypothetical protein [unclassified Flavobacterium]